MTTHPQPPPEAQLIRERREAPPKMSKRHAAELAGMSEGRWRQLEAGGYRLHGRWQPENAPDGTLARMARAVGVTAAELDAAGKPGAAAELAALPPLPDQGESVEDLFRRYLEAREEDRENFRRLEDKIDRYISGTGPQDEQQQEGRDDDGEHHGRRAG